MTEQLADLHDIPFSQHRAGNILLSLISGGFSASVSYRLLLSASKVLGSGLPLISAVGSGVTAGAATYAVGKVFSRHFAEGGTFLSFDPKKASAFYQKMFEEGRSVAADMKGGCCCRHAEQTAQLDEGIADRVEAEAEPTGPVEETAEPEVPAENAADQDAESTAATASGITIVDIFFQGKVKREQSDEYIEIGNSSASPADLSGWQIMPFNGWKVFTFPAGAILEPGRSCRVYTNEIHPESGGFSFASSTAVWRDLGSIGILRNAAGQEVCRFAYGDKKEE
jgi:hypothetical protein